MKIFPGKLYVTNDGRHVGPMVLMNSEHLRGSMRGPTGQVFGVLYDMDGKALGGLPHMDISHEFGDHAASKVPDTDAIRVTLTNVRHGDGLRADTIYAQLRSADDDELFIAATLEYCLRSVEERGWRLVAA